MLGSAASNATLVKTRMKYARMLTSAQYRELMDCPGISEIASTLSSVPPFDHLLADARSRACSIGATSKFCCAGPLIKKCFCYVGLILR